MIFIEYSMHSSYELLSVYLFVLFVSIVFYDVEGGESLRLRKHYYVLNECLVSFLLTHDMRQFICFE